MGGGGSHAGCKCIEEGEVEEGEKGEEDDGGTDGEIQVVPMAWYHRIHILLWRVVD